MMFGPILESSRLPPTIPRPSMAVGWTVPRSVPREDA
jgi:hypothetical protein